MEVNSTVPTEHVHVEGHNSSSAADAYILHGLFAEQTYSENERDLLTAILYRSILDCKSTIEKHRVEALEWILEDDAEEEEFSFLWICEHLDIDAGKLRRLVIDDAAEDSASFIFRSIRRVN